MNERQAWLEDLNFKKPTQLVLKDFYFLHSSFVLIFDRQFSFFCTETTNKTTQSFLARQKHSWQKITRKRSTQSYHPSSSFSSPSPFSSLAAFSRFKEIKDQVFCQECVVRTPSWFLLCGVDFPAVSFEIMRISIFLSSKIQDGVVASLGWG